ncbi:DNA polymerase III subunit beta [Enterobacteriaceae endosymbiont of Donacia versicolorea]|uniref:DNA polymerase III subunit beta n=1 Tax=Enterobacteriaceae endosymbiont of Donacia versicolorea TaxID=2675788 RepID=UPI001448B124|nr:DNA polymerase III subunit beta [Enterobacteriaceae endosymbiont of Donacia versicolorea]QJC32270.1 DNA polymerase III subunit beta [Enterobacteriaceae endosymbiont of Donacia versicolorea]
MDHEIIINRELLIKPLQHITNIITNHSILPIINNILIEFLENGMIIFKSTNLEIEIISIINNKFNKKKYSITIQGKKFYNICYSLPKNKDIKILFNKNQAIISSQKCLFTITTFPIYNFPKINFFKHDIEFNITHKLIKTFINSTYFSIANNDVRKYLNGLLLKIKNNILNIVSTDGHRLSIYTTYISNTKIINNYAIIVPRKSIFELSKLIKNTDELINIKINNNNICFIFNNLKFTSKLIKNEFPNYLKIIPKTFDKTININRIFLKNALYRISILVNNNTKGVTLSFKNYKLKIFSININNETAEEILTIDKHNNKIKCDIDISINISYLIDVINVLDGDIIKISFINNISSIRIEDNSDKNKFYLIMPMKI